MKKYGKGAVIKLYSQKSTLALEGMPGTKADYSDSTAGGQAKRYTVKKGATQPLGLQLGTCEITGVDVSASGRRQLQVRARRRSLRASSVSVTVAITSPTDLSATVGGAGFLGAFQKEYKLAVDTVPASIKSKMTSKETSDLAAQKARQNSAC